MSNKPYDPKHPVAHIEHQQEKRANIPTTERQGEEKGRQLAVRVISQFGEESTKVIALD